MKKLLRQWTEHRKIINHHGEIELVEVHCREFEYHYVNVEMYATGKDWGSPVYEYQFELREDN